MDLRNFIQRLDQAGELIRITERVSPNLEISEITDRISKMEGGGKALLFENTGTPYPVLINSMGSEERIRLAFHGKSPGELAVEIHQLIASLTGPDTGFMGKFRKLPLLGRAARWFPKKSKNRGRCQEIIDMKPDLDVLPVLKCWPHDGGPFITLPLVHTKDPMTLIPNLGMYRMQVFDKKSTGMHWHMHKTGARHYNEYKKIGQRMPVAVGLGGDPVYTYCATAPLPDGIDEYILAGFIRKKPVHLVKCITQDLWVPDDCDFIIEGYVDPMEPKHQEGPFGDHTGFYSLEDEYPVFHVTAITRRDSAIYPATIVGVPPQEDAWLEWATERMFEPLIRLSLVPELSGFHMPIPGVAHNLVLAKIQTSYPGQGRKVLHTLWGAGQMMFTKFAIVTANEVDLTDYLEVARYVSARVDPSKHIALTQGPLDILDHSSAVAAFGGKLGIDATGSVLEENNDFSRHPDDSSVGAFRAIHPEITGLNLQWLSKGISIVLIALQKGSKGAVRDIIDDIRLTDAFSGIRFWVLFDHYVDLTSAWDLTWLTGANVDALNDVVLFPAARNQKFGMLFIDATVKTHAIDNFPRPWPNPVVMDQTTIQLIDSKWENYGLGPIIESPSIKYSKLTRSGEARIK
ncbi:MAG: menaquinone biosynthesis decarboxylase [Bacteroidetes bacterium GWF2_49_14]|nr:MAG: menaquinone biosynthesis decarboxylase [Bacteroidetes bacterium GWF2_49_14]HBB93321.1 menaquinone biosynthesis decarboxylase [Bacteroidales bacterium]